MFGTFMRRRGDVFDKDKKLNIEFHDEHKKAKETQTAQRKFSLGKRMIRE